MTLYLPTLCGLKAFGFKWRQTPENVASSKSPRHFPKGRQLVRQEVDLRALKVIIRQAVEEVEGAETSRKTPANFFNRLF